MNYFNFQLIQPFNKNICYDAEKKQLLKQLQQLKKINVYCVIYGTCDYDKNYFLSFLAETNTKKAETLKDYINTMLTNQNWTLNKFEVKGKK